MDNVLDHMVPAEPSDRRYRSCVGCCHVKQGTFVLGVLELILSVGLLLYTAAQIHNRSMDESDLECYHQIMALCKGEINVTSFLILNATIVGDYLR